MATKRKEIVMTRDQTDQLIYLFEQDDDLWNISSENYPPPPQNKKEKRDAALQRIKGMNDAFDCKQPFLFFTNISVKFFLRFID